MVQKRRLSLMIFVMGALLLGGGKVNGDTPVKTSAAQASITLTVDKMGINSYGTYTKEIDGVTFKSEEIMKGTNPKDSLQFKNSAGKIYNTTAIDGKITNISFSQSGSISFLVSTGPSASSLTGQGAKSTANMSWDITAADHTYFLINNTGNAAYVPSITITYEPINNNFGTLHEIELDIEDVKKVYNPGDTFTTIDLGVTAIDTEGERQNVLLEDIITSYDNVTFDENDLGVKEVEVKYTLGTVTAKAYYDIEVKAVPIPLTFKKVTNQDDVKVGGRYVITAINSGTVYAMSSTQGSNNRAAVAATMSGANIKEATNTQVFELVEGTKQNTFAFKIIGTELDGQYIYAASSSKNYLRTQESKNDNSSWAIVVGSNDIAAITAQGTITRNQLKYNKDNNGLFSCYSSGQTGVSLYVDQTSINDDNEAYNEAKVLADWMMHADRAGEECEAKFYEAWGMWDGMSEDAKVEFKTHADFTAARARLVQWVIANGGDSLDDLDFTINVAPNIVEQRNPLGALLIVGLIGITTLAGYYFISRKEQRA